MTVEPGPDLTSFARTVTEFIAWAQQTGVAGEQANEVTALVRSHLGTDRQSQSVVSKEFPAFDQVNLQLALNSWAARDRHTVTVQGIAVPPNWGEIVLLQLISGEGLPPIRLSAPALDDLPSGPGRTLACWQQALLLVDDPDLGNYVILVRGPVQHQSQAITVEIAGLPVAAAQQVQAELAALRSELNVYRGQVLEVGTDDMGSVSVVFVDLPRTEREDVVLPAEVLQRIERHTIEIARHRKALLAAGQHLKRGLLLFGPPGTGKTHTTRYVIGRMTGYTVLMLSGRALHLIGAITELARELQPAVVVLEDVDLVAENRGFGPGSNPVLFELLDAMDGAAADADLLFLLTTNRADMLEPALAARPGRVDVAVEIDLPDAVARQRLLELYGAPVPLRLTEDEVVAVVSGTEGVTASFLKELVRRAVLESLRAGASAVAGEHVLTALDDLLNSSQSVTRALLGVGATSGPDDAEADAINPEDGGWTAYTPLVQPGIATSSFSAVLRGPMPGRYRG